MASATPLLLRLLALTFLSLALVANAADPDPLQDVCVADLKRGITVNGFPCKPPSSTNVEDFVFHGLAKPTDTNNPIGANVSTGFVQNYPGLNTLGLSIARLDFAKGGLIAPHTHPRASEIIFVVKGSLYAGFVTGDNKLFAKVINAGDVMIFPRGLIHWQLNVGHSNALAIVTLNGQDPGFQDIASSMFGSDILDEVLIKTFFTDKATVDKLKSTFSS